MFILPAWLLLVALYAGASARQHGRISQTPQQIRQNLQPASQGAGVKKQRFVQKETRAPRLLFSFVRPPGALLDEQFESPTFPPAGWSLDNPDPGSLTWEHSPGVSGFGRGTGSVRLNFFDYEFDRGDVDLLQTMTINGISAGDSLFFDVAYAEYDNPSFGPDSLLVMVSADGGLMFDTLYSDGGEGLATAPATSSSFVPGAAEWLTRRTGFPPSVVGVPVILLFAGINNYGNNLYLDNIFVGVQPPVDLHAVDILSPLSGSKQSATVHPAAIFRNAGTAGQTGATVRFQILNAGSTIVYDNSEVLPSFPAGAVDTVLFPDFVMPPAPAVYTARAIASISGDANSSNDTVAVPFYRPVDLAGVITVGTGGQIPTLRGAIDSLNRNRVGGNLTFQLVSPDYSEPAPLTISGVDGTGPDATVTIRPAPGISPVITIDATEEEPYAIGILGSRYISLDGLWDARSAGGGGITIVAEGEHGLSAVYVAGLPGMSSSYSSLRNLHLRTGADSVTSSSGYYGVFVNGWSSSQKDTGIVVADCDITRHGQAGIAAMNAHTLTVERTVIRDWVQYGGFADLRGIWLSAGTTGAILRGNVIRTIQNRVNGWWTIGVQNGGGAGSSLLCVNNMITDVGSSGAGNEQNFTGGILSSSISNSDDKYFFNSVSLSVADSSTSPASRVSGFEFTSIAPANVRLSNNIVSNTSTIAGGGSGNRAYGVYFPISVAWPSSDTSNHNNWHTPGVQGSVGFIGSNRVSLADWQGITGQDANSISADPLFVDGTNPHISFGSSPVGNTGTPLPQVTVDFDGEMRDALTPDIGADEFSGTHASVGVPVLEGWTMISNPVTRPVGTDSVRQLYPSSAFPYVFGFQGPTGYVASGTMQNGPGYWGKFPAAAISYVAGDLLAADTIAVQAGWNMVGSISVAVDTATVSSIPPGIRSSQWFGYGGGYSPAGHLLPGRAYWVKASAPGQFVLTSPP